MQVFDALRSFNSVEKFISSLDVLQRQIGRVEIQESGYEKILETS